MANPKRSTNPLLAPAVSGFSLSESFGPQAPLIVPSALPVTQPDPGRMPPPPNLGPYTSSPDVGSLAPPPLQGSTAISGSAPTPLGPPPAGVFLLPNRGLSPGLSPIPPAISVTSVSQSSPLGPPPMMSPLPSAASTTVLHAKRSPYVPPPGIPSSASSFALSRDLGPSVPPPPMPHSSSVPSFNEMSQFSSFVNDSQPASRAIGAPSFQPTPFDAGSHNTIELNAASYQPVPPVVQKATDMAYHWFYQVNSSQQQQSSPSWVTSTPSEIWKPFTMIDSCAIEDIYLLNPNTNEPVATDGGRYDVFIKDRIKTAVYWKDENNDQMKIRRCSWFYKSNLDGRWVPFDEDLSSRLENEFVSAVETGRWNCRLDISNGEYITIHSESVIVHFPSTKSSFSGSVDDWGQVQAPTDPALKPREVHRGLDGLPEIPDGEPFDVDHLVFIVHGIGSVCDIKFRTIAEVVDGFRELSNEMSQKHFQSAHLSEKANRIEFLPVNWHRTLHGQDTGTDQKLKPLTLKSIPKLREFVNDTLLDILFYTSPVYCQTIINTVVSEINRMYTLFMARNETFKGKVSIIGHSLGSLIVFDILSHQVPSDLSKDNEKDFEKTILAAQNVTSCQELTLEQVFEKLEIREFAENFTKEGIDMEALAMCNEEDLKEGGLPLGPRKKLLKYLNGLKAAKDPNCLNGLELYQQQSIESEVKYIFGPAGSGQLSVHYPRLDMEFSSFYALGSPVAMFMSVRGIDQLGSDFSFPTCPRFFNIFHPFDPVAYRVEGLIKPEYGLTLRPVTIPHHKGRKRMHLELKDTVTKIMSTDIKQKILDSVSATINAVYSIAVGNSYESTNSKSVEQVVEQDLQEKAHEADKLDSQNPKTIESKLNQGMRIDYALQEAPLESFNEYLFALAAHLCYWESEDTCLMILKDIYSQLNILSDDQLTSTANPPSVPYLNAGVGRPPKVETPAFSPYQPYGVSDVVDLQSQPPPSGPVPTFQAQTTFNPPAMPQFPGPGGNSKTRPSYPKQIYPVSSPHASPAMGMDPTAPPSYESGPIAPPPMVGFVRKS